MVAITTLTDNKTEFFLLDTLLIHFFCIFVKFKKYDYEKNDISNLVCHYWSYKGFCSGGRYVTRKLCRYTN